MKEKIKEEVLKELNKWRPLVNWESVLPNKAIEMAISLTRKELIEKVEKVFSHNNLTKIYVNQKVGERSFGELAEILKEALLELLKEDSEKEQLHKMRSGQNTPDVPSERSEKKEVKNESRKKMLVVWKRSA